MSERASIRAVLALAAVCAAPGAGAQMAQDPEILARLEAQDRARRKEFDLAARRGLPAKTAERLARARQAYEEGQGRLLELLRAGKVEDAEAIRERLDAAARREPISAGDLKIKAPTLTPPTLSAGEPKAAADEGPPGDLDSVIGPVPSVLVEAAAALDGPVAVFEWVRNNIKPELYHGAMKGAVQTCREGSGNDADTAGVLVEMLRAKGIPARYVHGTAQVRAETAT